MEKNLKIKYVETDFEEVTQRKASLIKDCSKLKQLLGDSEKVENQIDEKSGKIHTEKYHLVSVDLRDSKELQRVLLEECGLSSR